MPIWHKDKELSYSRYKAKMDLTKIGKVASVLALLAGVLLRGTTLARIRSRVSVLALHVLSDGMSRELSQS